MIDVLYGPFAVFSEPRLPRFRYIPLCPSLPRCFDSSGGFRAQGEDAGCGGVGILARFCSRPQNVVCDGLYNYWLEINDIVYGNTI